MKFIILYFIFFLGHGTYFSTLSPFIVDSYHSGAGYVFMAGQLAFPAGTLLIGYISDRTHELRSLLVGSLLIHAPLQFLLYSTTDNLPLAIALGAANRFLFAVNLQLASIAVLEARGTPAFGRIRAWGTVGFFLIHLSLFFVESGGYIISVFPQSLDAATTGKAGSIFHLISGILALSVQKMRHSPQEFQLAGVVKVLRKPETVFFLFLSFFFFFSFQVVDYYLGAFLKKEGGMATVYLGWSIAVLLEIPLLAMSGKWSDRFGPRSLFLVSLGAGILRFAWISMTIQGWIHLPVIYSQILHGLHFTGYYMGAIYYLRRAYPDHLYGTGYGAYVIISNSLGGALGSLAASHLLQLPPSSMAGLDLDAYFIMFTIAAIIHFLLFFSFLFPGLTPTMNRSSHNPDR